MKIKINKDQIMILIVVFFLGFLGIILRDTLFNSWSIAGGKPDFILLLTIFYAIFNGYLKGGLVGLCLGLLEDLMTGRFIGVNAICKGLIGMILGFTNKSLYKDNYLVPILCLLLGSLGSSLIYFILSKLIGSNIYFSGMLMTAIPDAIYTTCFAPVLYGLFYWLSNRPEE